MKRFFAFSLIFLCVQFYSQNAIFNTQNYGEYTLQNGMEVFILEDFSNATIKIEFSVKAGISSQNKDNTGCFTLYQRIFEKTFKSKTPSTANYNITSECNADSTRYILELAPSQTENALFLLSDIAFNPFFDDNIIKQEFLTFKTELQQLASSPATFINSSIDSKVFSSAPWKQDSGIYPAIFQKLDIEKNRSLLNAISKNWYAPQNSAIFITGCIKKQDALKIIKNTFGAYEGRTNPAHISTVKAGAEHKKFVLVDNQFSKDITQIVVQYTSLSMNQADILATMFNEDNSECKKLLLRQKNLAIRGAEYINVAAAHKNGTSRLIFQSLLEKPVNKKVTLADQAELFVSKSKESIKISKSHEYSTAKKTLIESFNTISSNSTNFMNYLSQFWAIESLNQFDQTNKNLLAERFFQRITQINDQSIREIQNSFNSEKPFVFILLNTNIYKENKEAFYKLGYQEITQNNGSWYKQKIIQDTLENPLDDESILSNEQDYLKDTKDFIEQNKKSISKFHLKNDIPVVIKNSNTTSNVVMMLCIEGGKFYSPQTYGFEKVMVNAFAQNIQKEINKYRQEQFLEGEPTILCETFNSYSAISIECIKEDAAICLKCMSDALIFGEITPTEADSLVFSEQTQKRLYNANAQNQLYFRAIRYFYDDIHYQTVFDSEKDILQTTTYTDILKAYPIFLDASLYNLVIVGNIDEDYLKHAIQNTLGLLTKTNSANLKDVILPVPDFPNDKTVSTQIKHLFYTDISKEEAGPMPAILIPTTNFSDPAQYWFYAPQTKISEKQLHTDYIIFDALIYRLKEILEKNKTDEFSEIKLNTRNNEIPCATYTFLTVSHTETLSKLFAKCVNELKENLNGENAQYETQNILNAWILNALKKTNENRGTALLIKNGKNNPKKYLEDYELLQETTIPMYQKILTECIPAKAPFRVYSTDAKK